MYSVQNSLEKAPHGHTDRTIQFKNEILDRLQKGEKAAALAKEKGIPANTISTWKKQRHQIKKNIDSGVNLQSKRSHKMKKELVEEALILWFQDLRARARPVPLSTLGLQEQAEK